MKTLFFEIAIISEGKEVYKELLKVVNSKPDYEIPNIIFNIRHRVMTTLYEGYSKCRFSHVRNIRDKLKNDYTTNEYRVTQVQNVEERYKKQTETFDPRGYIFDGVFRY